MNEPDIQWVHERAKCNMVTLSHDLRSLVRKNVTAINTECRRRNWSEFSYEGDDLSGPAPYSITQPYNGGTRRCTFAYDPEWGWVTVKMVHPDREYTILTRWDSGRAQCLIVLTHGAGSTSGIPPQEFPHADLWRVIQIILEPFFFSTNE